MSEHDPLCLLYPRSDGRSRGFCVCDVIQQARRDMLARCIATVDALEDQEDFYTAEELTGISEAGAALRALGGDHE